MLDVAFDSEVLPGIRFNAFESCLPKRHSHNVGLIRKLTLARCHNIGEPEVQSLRRLVDDVEWDGCTLGQRQSWTSQKKINLFMLTP